MAVFFVAHVGVLDDLFEFGQEDVIGLALLLLDTLLFPCHLTLLIILLFVLFLLTLLLRLFRWLAIMSFRFLLVRTLDAFFFLECRFNLFVAFSLSRSLTKYGVLFLLSLSLRIQLSKLLVLVRVEVSVDIIITLHRTLTLPMTWSAAIVAIVTGVYLA